MKNTRTLVLVGLGLSTGAFISCFDGEFLVGQPCSSDGDCGPTLTCQGGVCGGIGGEASSGSTVPPLTTSGLDTSTTSGSSTSSSDTSPLSSDTSAEPLSTTPDAYLIGNCGGRPWESPVGLLDNDGLDDLASLSITFLTEQTAGTVEDRGDGRFAYTPPGSYAQPDSFSYTVMDEQGRVSEPTEVTLQPTAVQLDTTGQGGSFLTIQGELQSRTGVSVAAAGDVNGDFNVDLLIGAHLTDEPEFQAGATYVVFGSPDRAKQISLDDDPFEHGFSIRGVSSDHYSGLSVAGAGDVNNDGFDDLIVASPGYQNPDGSLIGRVYLVLGAKGANEVSLADLDTENSRVVVLLEGSSDGDWVGLPVGDGVVWDPGAKQQETVDIGADGFPDVVITRSRWTSESDAGSVFWLHDYSLDNMNVLSTDDVTNQAIRLDGAFAGSGGYGFGLTTRLIGDINGDGVPELAAVSDTSTAIAGDRNGRLYVALSPHSPGTSQSIDDLTFVLQGGAEDRLGRGLADLDINNDGHSDLIVGAPGRQFGSARGGQVYVIYGGPSLVDPPALADLDTETSDAGLVIRGNHLDNESTEVGRALDDAGDFNGDGFRDLVIGAPVASNELIHQCSSDGVTYVVFGFAPDDAPRSISLDELTCGPEGSSIGVVILPEPLLGRQTPCMGWSVAGVGDFDQDGCDDILLGAPYQFSPGGTPMGRAYVVYGFDPTTPDRTCPHAGRARPRPTPLAPPR
ncbi:MAG: cadherin-like domain-containing protein [Myxococcota bacterium]